VSAISEPGSRQLAGRSIVTGVIGEDIHVVGLRIVEHALRAAGATVVSVGIQASQADFVDATLEADADAIFVSSSNGHASASSDGLKDALLEAGASEVLLYIGGHLVVGSSAGWSAIAAQFASLGFDRVYPPRTEPSVAVADLASDLASRSLS
jgi:methylaspartate mutase sigma subunit